MAGPTPQTRARQPARRKADPKAPARTSGDDRRKDKATRMLPDDRREMILTGAMGFFARHGFKAQTRELAAELGVSQPLIYRYFGSKRNLVESVYQRNFIARWRDDWAKGLADRDTPLRERLRRFYLGYLDVIDNHDWIRIAMYSGLADNALTKRYIERQVDRLLILIAEELRHDGTLAPATGKGAATLDDVAYEHVWHLHSTFIYYCVRKHVLHTRVTASHEVLVRTVLDDFLPGNGG